MTLLLNRELVSGAKLCLVSVFPDIVKDCSKLKNLPQIFLRSFKNVGAVLQLLTLNVLYLLFFMFCIAVSNSTSVCFVNL